MLFLICAVWLSAVVTEVIVATPNQHTINYKKFYRWYWIDLAIAEEMDSLDLITTFIFSYKYFESAFDENKHIHLAKVFKLVFYLTPAV
jgi:hypothetical protein